MRPYSSAGPDQCPPVRRGRDPALGNSRDALHQSLAMGVDFVEFDVQRCDDGTLVALPRRHLPRGRRARLRSRSHHRRAGAALGPRPADYDEVLALLAGRRRAHIDLKVTGRAALHDDSSARTPTRGRLPRRRLLGVDGLHRDHPARPDGPRDPRMGRRAGAHLLVGPSLGRNDARLLMCHRTGADPAVGAGPWAPGAALPRLDRGRPPLSGPARGRPLRAAPRPAVAGVDRGHSRRAEPLAAAGPSLAGDHEPPRGGAADPRRPPQPSRNDPSATTPTITMTTRSTGAGSRRPTVAPSWAPITEPTPISADDAPVHVGDHDEEHARDAVDHGGEHVLDAVQALEGLVDADPQDRHQQHALRGAEVAAVHAGEQHARPHPPGAVLGQPAGRVVAARDPRRRSGAGRPPAPGRAGSAPARSR